MTQTPEETFWMPNTFTAKMLFVLITCAVFLLMWFGLNVVKSTSFDKVFEAKICVVTFFECYI